MAHAVDVLVTEVQSSELQPAEAIDVAIASEEVLATHPFIQAILPRLHEHAPQICQATPFLQSTLHNMHSILPQIQVTLANLKAFGRCPHAAVAAGGATCPCGPSAPPPLFASFPELLANLFPMMHDGAASAPAASSTAPAASTAAAASSSVCF